MHPIFLQLGPLTIRWYGVMAAVGFLLAAALITLNRKRAGMSENQASTLTFIAIICGVTGARIFYVMENWSTQFRGNFPEVFRIDHGGLVFYGGFFLAMAGIITYCRMAKLDMIRVMDVFTPGLALGHAVGRIGCFLNGCCFGKITHSWLGVHYPEGSGPAMRFAEAPVHPVQLYEAGGNILLTVFLLILLRRSGRGITMAAYMVLYGALRFGDEFFRGDYHYNELWLGIFTPGQVIGLLLIPAGIFILIHFVRKHGQQNHQIDH
ncbi:MAG: prolipoprotein diacylglyceryl transferase [Victivallaceae bacterium]|nr:prolipoprotein diacylglyceryl transferase [Victivallaceae bacterium]